VPALLLFLRSAALATAAAPLLLAAAQRRGERKPRAATKHCGRAPVVANFSAFGLLLASLFIFAASPEAAMTLLMALVGLPIAFAGMALVLRSRAELGAAWSLVPRIGEATGLVTTGPYHLVRHPIYLGLALLALGEALAFGSLPALFVVACGIVPTFVWRARVEERLLSATFGEEYAAYRRRTKMIVPYVL
jgi:protein-S-isoprenylcysteine O-methyltransferase Ste14